ncbi:MAG: hypothetical protein ACFNXZ_12300 [Lautropia mirabilis]
MTRITRLEFRAESGSGSRMQWNHRGSGHVHVMVDGPDVFFQETFTLDNGLPCQDRKCWHFGEEGIIFRHFREQRFQDILLLVPDARGLIPCTTEQRTTGSGSTGLHATQPSSVQPGAVQQISTHAGPLPSGVIPPGGIHLVAQTPYSCPPDHYDGSLSLHDGTLELRLRITGARKDEDIRYRYRADPG